MACLSVRSLVHSFGGPPLFDGLELHLEEGDRLCLIGRNGTGKSTFLKVLAGQIEPDQGEVIRRKGLTCAYLGQEIPRDMQGTALEYAAAGGDSLEAEKALTLLDMDPAAQVAPFSGGEKRRVLLARVLASGAEVLLLDEPTNHLDVERIEQLEEYLLRQVKTFIFVTHDRAFARRLASRVAEIDRGQIYAFNTGYDDFVSRRDELLEAERLQRADFDRKLAEEEAWLRQGVKARRTRNEGRVKALLGMRKEQQERREKLGSASLKIQQAEKSGKLVAETENLSFAYNPEQWIIKDLTLMIMRGDHVGIAGPSGAGKTTLIKLLLGELEPTAGHIRLGTRLQPVYLDQMRSTLDPDKSVQENLAGHYETIELAGGRKHVLAYLKDFLFSADRARSPVAHLSGGERNRLLLAKLFAQPSNVLILDEPTNDLDVETLELLEEKLQDYPGTLFLVSHDRDFLDRVITDCLILESNGVVKEYPGAYSEWRALQQREKKETAAAPASRVSAPVSEKTRRSRSRRMSYREKEELAALPERLSQLEAQQEELHQQLSDPEIYRTGVSLAGELSAQLNSLEEEMEKAFARWEELEALSEELNES